MKGAQFVSDRPSVFAEAAVAVAARGGHVSEDMAQWRDRKGRLFTMFASDGSDWEFRQPPWAAVGPIPWPDMTRVSGGWIECRWEDLFVVLVAEMAEAVDGLLWVIDGDDVLWDALHVDPARVCL